VDVISKCEFWDRWMFLPGCFPERQISASCYIASRIQVEEALRFRFVRSSFGPEALFCWDIELITSLLQTTRIAQASNQSFGG